MVSAGNEIERTVMNREHYLSKRLRSQQRGAFGRPDTQQSGMDADTLSLTTEIGENKRPTAEVVAKAEAGVEPDMKSGGR